MAPSAVYAQASSAMNKRKRKAEEAPVDEGSENSEGSISGDEVDGSEDDEEVSSDDEDVDDEDEQEPDDEPVFSKLAKGKKRARNQDITEDAVAEEAVNGAAAANGHSKGFRQKTLILSSRGITHRMRHMMKDLAALLPHSKTDAKLDTKHQLSLLNELADLSNCSSALFFEARRHQDLYMWASMTPNGPSVRFHLLNAHTMDELKMTGNCLKGSRPIVVFDATFDSKSEWRLMKEILMQIFAVPKTARRAKPFIDHVVSFSVADNRIWYRNYQIVHDAPLDLSAPAAGQSEADFAAQLASNLANKGKKSKNPEDNMSMNEIGPRFVLTPVKIFEGSFGGAVVWENKDFVSPTNKLAAAKLTKAVQYKGRQSAQSDRKGRREFLDAQEVDDKERSGRAALERKRVFA